MASGPDKDNENLEDDASPSVEAGGSASEGLESEKREEGIAPSAEPDASATGVAESHLARVPGNSEEPAVEDPHSEDSHHGEYDQYHDPYHEEHYEDHHAGEDDYHGEHGDFHDDYHYHDHHYDDPQHSAYRAGGAALASAAAAGPLDQRSVPDYEPELDEDGNPYGGPVKPFLDHLEDLRWVILKCVIAMMIAMMGCMMGAKHLVKVLMWPLDQAERLGTTTKTDIPVMLGHRTVGRLDLEGLGSMGIDTNAPIFSNAKGRYQMIPVNVGTNLFLALQPLIPEESKGYSTGFDEVMVDLKNYGPFQSIWLCLQLALYGGLVLGAPFIIFFVAEFVLPALKVNEKKFLYKTAGIGSLLFILGVAFCYFLIVQVALRASVEFSNWLGFSADEWNASEYLSFVVKFLLVMGVAFEMPVVLLTIVKIGLLDHKQLSEFRHYFIVGMLVVSAVITPSGDPFTMVLVAIPLWILYEICVIIARVWHKQDQAEEARRAAES